MPTQTQHPQQQPDNIERRYNAAPGYIKRDMSAEKSRRIEGSALLYDVVYDIGWFTEEIRRGAMAGADMSDIVALFNHDVNWPLARRGTNSNTLNLADDNVGFHYHFDSPDSPNGENVLVAVDRRDVVASSWAFTVEDAVWEVRDGRDHRVITKIKKVYDVSPVTYAANPDTTVALRSRPQAQQQVSEVNNTAAIVASIRMGGALASAGL